jgi:uncharacterized protein YbjQ (UPF0145 family)
VSGPAEPGSAPGQEPAGGPPHFADLALDALRVPGHGLGPESTFSSDLSVDEAILLGETGFVPCRLVMGSSIYHVGWARGSMLTSSTGLGPTFSNWGEGELTSLSRAMVDARNLAMSRLVSDAAQAGGEVVVGVRLTVEPHAGGGGKAEFTAIGTAIARRSAGARRPRRPHGDVVATDLSGQDFYFLDRAGWEPLGLVFGNCVYYVPPNWVPRTSPNQELEGPTRGLSAAREIAMGRLQREAEQPGVAGVVGVHVTQESRAFWRGATEFLAYGTAVRLKSDGGEAGHRNLDVRAVVGLDDPYVATDPSAITG